MGNAEILNYFLTISRLYLELTDRRLQESSLQELMDTIEALNDAGEPLPHTGQVLS